MSNQKIIIDADNGRLDAASKKSAAEVRKIADGAKDINTHFDKLGKSLVNRVAGLSAMVAVVRQIGDEVAKVRDKAAGASASAAATQPRTPFNPTKLSLTRYWRIANARQVIRP